MGLGDVNLIIDYVDPALLDDPFVPVIFWAATIRKQSMYTHCPICFGPVLKMLQSWFRLVDMIANAGGDINFEQFQNGNSMKL
jgi:hypothetical protein